MERRSKSVTFAEQPKSNTATKVVASKSATEKRK